MPVNFTGPHPYRASRSPRPSPSAPTARGLLGGAVRSGHDVASWFAFHRLWCSRRMSRTSGPVRQQIGMAKSSGLASGHRGAASTSWPIRPARPTSRRPGSAGCRAASDLEQLPDHHRLQHRADPARHDDEGVRDEHEVVQPGEERAVLEDLADERIDSCSNGKSTRMPTEARSGSAPAIRAPSFAACISPGPPPVMMSQPRRSAPRPGRGRPHRPSGRMVGPGRAEDGHAVARPPRRPEPRQVVDDLPQAEDGLREDLDVASSSPRRTMSEDLGEIILLRS